MADHIEELENAEECAYYLGLSYNLPADALMNDPMALVEATARWHIRGDEDAEALAWLSGLVSWQGRDSAKIACAAQHVLQTELLPHVRLWNAGSVTTYRS